MFLVCKFFLVITFINTNIFPQSLFSLGFDIKSGQCNYNKLIASNPYVEGDCNGFDYVSYAFNDAFENAGIFLGINVKNLKLKFGGHLGTTAGKRISSNDCSSFEIYEGEIRPRILVGGYASLGIFDLTKFSFFKKLENSRFSKLIKISPFLSYSANSIAVESPEIIYGFGRGIKASFTGFGYLVPHFIFEKPNGILNEHISIGFSFYFKKVS